VVVAFLRIKDTNIYSTHSQFGATVVAT